MIARVGMFVMVEMLGMYSGLTGRSDKMSAGFMNFGELTMVLQHRLINSIGASKNYNKVLIPK